MFAAALNRCQRLLRLGRHFWRMRQEFGETKHRVERGAEFMAHIREKRAFGVIGGVRLARGFLQLRVRVRQIMGARLHKGFKFLLPKMQALHAIGIAKG